MALPFIVPILVSALVGGGVAAAAVIPTVTSSVETVLPAPTEGDAPAADATTGGTGSSADVDYGTR